MRVAVITVSDRASAGVYADRSGPAVIEVLNGAIPGVEIEYEVVPDGEESVLAALGRHSAADWILTTGGTGPAPRDRTPEATLAYCDRQMEGIADWLRLRSLEETPNAIFSRGAAGMRGAQYVVNFPGSEKAARFCAAALAPLMDHGHKMAKGEGH